MKVLNVEFDNAWKTAKVEFKCNLLFIVILYAIQVNYYVSILVLLLIIMLYIGDNL